MTSIRNINPYRYRRYYYDTEINMYYLQSRYYMPEFGRFINFDNYGGQVGDLLSHSGFMYCLNNPINNYDPTGNIAFAIPIFGSIVKTAITAFLGGMSASLTYQLASEISKTQSRTRELDDVIAQKPKKERKVYFPAYVNKTTNKLEISGIGMTYVEARTALGIVGTLDKMFRSGKRDIGIYTKNQINAKQLALSIGILKEVPEVHGNQYYGHYHDNNRRYHIWYGGPINY